MTTKTCPRCTKMIGERTVTVQVPEGTIHLHCATREERDRQPERQTPSPRRRQQWRRYHGPEKTCRFGGYELDWDC